MERIKLRRNINNQEATVDGRPCGTDSKGKYDFHIHHCLVLPVYKPKLLLPPTPEATKSNIFNYTWINNPNSSLFEINQPSAPISIITAPSHHTKGKSARNLTCYYDEIKKYYIKKILLYFLNTEKISTLKCRFFF